MIKGVFECMGGGVGGFRKVSEKKTTQQAFRVDEDKWALAARLQEENAERA